MIPLWTAIHFFLNNAENADISPLGKGNINDTWLIQPNTGEKFVLQRLNPVVFNQPELIISNMRKVTSHLLAESRRCKIPPDDFTTTRLCPGKTGADFFQATDGSCWRLLSYIPASRTLQTINKPKQAFELGKKLGLFHKLCRNLEPKSLANTLPDFHITPNYLNKFDTAIALTTISESKKLTSCLNSIESTRKIAPIIENFKNTLTAQIIHGDPKVSNFLFADNNDKVICLIDLDTVKSGLLLYDIGDGLRSCCNPAGEDMEVPENAQFNQRFFQAWLSGYLEQAQFLLTKNDLELIVTSIQLITFELGLRFLTDYLTGNHYFKTNFPDHNLHRAQVQFALVESMTTIKNQLEHYISETTH